MSRRIDTSGKTTLSGEQAGAKQGGKLLFTAYNGQNAVFLIRDDRLRAVRLFPHRQSRIGAVYICKVKNAVRNLNAYFVEIGGEEREICFLSGRDAAHPFLLNRVWDGRILEGDEFPVQVTRDSAGTKQASVTTLISLATPYFALSVGNTKTGYSNKLNPARREELKGLLDSGRFAIPRARLPLQAELSEGTGRFDKQGDEGTILPVGLVVRTRAAELLEISPASEKSQASEQFAVQWQILVNRWEKLFQAALHRTCFSCLLEAPAPWEAALEELVYPYEYEEIVTDDSALYEQLQALPSIPADKRIRLYGAEQSARFPLTKLYGLESKMETALNRRVWLKSGGYLVIDPTEALTVIDVNSGKYEAGRNAEETYFAINREAAEEIACQLRLRNLSGMILVDFINMESGQQQTRLMEYLRELVKKDKQQTIVVDMTALGLVEITRKKGSRALSDQLEKKNGEHTESFYGGGTPAWN